MSNFAETLRIFSLDIFSLVWLSVPLFLQEVWNGWWRDQTFVIVRGS